MRQLTFGPRQTPGASGDIHMPAPRVAVAPPSIGMVMVVCGSPIRWPELGLRLPPNRHSHVLSWVSVQSPSQRSLCSKLVAGKVCSPQALGLRCCSVHLGMARGRARPWERLHSAGCSVAPLISAYSGRLGSFPMPLSSSCVPLGIVLVSWDCCDKGSQAGWLKQQTVDVLAVWRPEVRQSGSVCGLEVRSSLGFLGLWLCHSSLCFCLHREVCVRLPLFLFLGGPQSHWTGPPTSSVASIINHVCKHPVSQ